MVPKLGLKIAQDIAVFRGGVCLSGSYENNRAKLKWQCNKGHEWSASLNSIKDNGSWCPYCARTARLCESEDKKLGLKIAQETAVFRGGVCLSGSYENSHAKLKWQCNKGHELVIPLDYPAADPEQAFVKLLTLRAPAWGGGTTIVVSD